MPTNPSPQPPADNGAYAAARSGAISGGRALFARHAVVGVLSLAGTTALVRLVGVADWAIVAQGYFLVVFLDLALGGNLLGGLVRRRGRLETADVQAAARIALIAAVAILAAGVALAVPAAVAFGRWEWGLCLVAVGVGGAVFALRSVPVALLERDLEYRTVAAVEVLDQVTFYLIAVPAAVLGGGVPVILAALAVRAIPGAVIVHRRRSAPLLGRHHRGQVRDLLEFGRPSSGSSAIVLLDGLVPLAVLGAQHARELGFVLTASTILGYAAVLQLIAQRIGFASLARLKGDAERFRFAVGRAATVSTVVIVPAILPLAGLGGLWLPVLFGPEWVDATWIVSLLGVMMLLQTPINLATAMLNADDRPGAVLVLRIVQTGTYAAVAVPLAAGDPLLGVPVAAVVGRGVAALTALWICRELMPRYAYPWLSLVPVVAGAATLALTAAAERNAPAAVAGSAVAVAIWAALNRPTLAILRRSAIGGGPSAPVVLSGPG